MFRFITRIRKARADKCRAELQASLTYWLSTSRAFRDGAMAEADLSA